MPGGQLHPGGGRNILPLSAWNYRYTWDFLFNPLEASPTESWNFSLQFLRTGDRDGRYLTALGGMDYVSGRECF